MRKSIMVLLFTFFASTCFAQGEQGIQYTIFSYNKNAVNEYLSGCLAIIAWNDAAKKLLGGSMPDKLCKWELGVKAIPFLDERLKRKGVATGYSTNRLIIINASPNYTNNEIIQLVVNTTR